jgi:hypothetical protein
VILSDAKCNATGRETSQSVVHPCELFPQNWPAVLFEYDVPKAAIVFKLFWGAVASGYSFCKPVSKVTNPLEKDDGMSL